MFRKCSVTTSLVTSKSFRLIEKCSYTVFRKINFEQFQTRREPLHRCTNPIGATCKRGTLSKRNKSDVEQTVEMTNRPRMLLVTTYFAPWFSNETTYFSKVFKQKFSEFSLFLFLVSFENLIGNLFKLSLYYYVFVRELQVGAAQSTVVCFRLIRPVNVLSKDWKIET